MNANLWESPCSVTDFICYKLNIFNNNNKQITSHNSAVNSQFLGTHKCSQCIVIFLGTHNFYSACY